MTACTARGSDTSGSPVSAGNAEFLASFENCRLPAAEWTHLAHVRIAWTCLNLDTPVTAIERIRRGIRRYNADVLDRPQQYHDTVTIAFARIIRARMRGNESWEAFSRRIDDLLDSDSPVLLQYYSEARLFSDAARQHFVAPDKRELPAFD